MGHRRGFFEKLAHDAAVKEQRRENAVRREAEHQRLRVQRKQEQLEDRMEAARLREAMKPQPFPCDHCGAECPAKAIQCPECRAPVTPPTIQQQVERLQAEIQAEKDAIAHQNAMAAAAQAEEERRQQERDRPKNTAIGLGCVVFLMFGFYLCGKACVSPDSPDTATTPAPVAQPAKPVAPVAPKAPSPAPHHHGHHHHARTR